jgi:rSAM/selenodomain-associated transferase 2
VGRIGGLPVFVPIMPKPELSIIIPTLNEVENLPLLLSDLERQKGLYCEVIVADGGSVDGTSQFADDFFVAERLPGTCLVGTSGRGRQLNTGVLAANSDWLLFLHADSRLAGDSQLQEALDFIQSHQRQASSDSSAGRFVLRFDSPSAEESFGLFYYEAKASLGRPGCIHGDQGLLLTKDFFQRVGPFRQDLPVMEDTSLAEKIRTTGQWLVLPGEIVTSARRFQIEGLKARQTLNALMMNFLAIGWLEFFAKAPDIYRQQDRTQPLQLLPFFRLIKELFDEMPISKRWGIYLATGGYVRSQAWQIGLALDCRKTYRQGLEVNHQSYYWLNWFDRWFDPLTNHCIGRTLTALLVRAWFAWQLRGKPENCSP